MSTARLEDPLLRGRSGWTIRRILAVPEVGILLPLAAFTFVFWLLNPVLLDPKNLIALASLVSLVGIIMIGQALLLIVGELDLSVGSVAGLCAIVTAWLTHDAHWPLALAIAAGLGAGALVGLVNGVVAVGLQVPAFITTLGMLYIAKGANYLLCEGYPIAIPEALVSFGRAKPLGLMWSFLIFVALAVLADLALRLTIYGRMIYATGGNREVARIAGIHTTAVKIICYVITGMLSALAGILMMAKIRVGQPEIGTGMELETIASVVIGGVSLFGGRGTIASAVLGLLTMKLVTSGLVMTGVSTHWQTVAVGLIMIGAVSFDLLRRRVKLH
jgi:ribose transport system permease protein